MNNRMEVEIRDNSPGGEWHNQVAAILEVAERIYLRARYSKKEKAYILEDHLMKELGEAIFGLHSRRREEVTCLNNQTSDI